MRKFPIVFVLLIALLGCEEKIKQSHNVVTSDITNFWLAYDKIRSTQDSVLQYKYLDSFYFQKGTVGLEGMREARNYSPKDYIEAINGFPKFWNSIRESTLKSDEIRHDLELGIEKLKRLYPDTKPAKIYFTIGALRSPGTTVDSLVLIGSELAMADNSTITSEFPEQLSHLEAFFETNPKAHQVFLNVHEYVHTQQKSLEFNILSQTVFEGVAEFVAAQALGIASPNPQIEFGKNNAKRIRAVFETEMFYPNNLSKWLYGNATNEFGMRDLGYYVGYQICENYFNQAENKQDAIKTMIELNYANETEVEDFVKKANYFSASLEELYQNFENKRPIVIGIKQFENNSQYVSPNTKEITIQFSAALNGHHTSVDFGDLGQSAFPEGTLIGRKWSEDNRSWTIPVALAPNTSYQVLISNNFRTENDIPLKPYLIAFKTGSK